MNTRLGTPEEYMASYAYIPVSGASGLKCHEARRTGIETVSGKAVYELIDANRKPVSHILYVVDNGELIPVAQYRADVLVRAAEYEAARVEHTSALVNEE
jgi:hypothetical protein